METNSAVSQHWVMIKGKDGKELVPVRYDQFVLRLFKADSFNEMVHHAKGGVCEEAGEISDVLKRNITYGITLNSPIKPKEGPKTVREALVEELGDIMFYIQAIKNLYNISDFEVHQGNATKLGKRYADLVWTKEEATVRNDEVPALVPPTTGHMSNDEIVQFGRPQK